jgi:hypothetical protein
VNDAAPAARLLRQLLVRSGSHSRQLLKYKDLLLQMGYSQVHAFLIYLKTGLVRPVEIN